MKAPSLVAPSLIAPSLIAPSLLVLGLIAALSTAAPSHAATLADLVRAYPEALARVDGTDLIWRDGTRMAAGPAHPGLDGADNPQGGSILDQLAAPYPAGALDASPQGDPGRVRNPAFFDKLYGDCRRGQVAPQLVPVVWLPNTWGHTVSITSVGGVDRRLAAISRELDELPAGDKRFLYPSAGTYNCRTIAGAAQPSMHAWGAAIDINTAYSDYWRWRHGAYRNRIPASIVAVFERHGFIWGGRWSHYDTMHFEYRPELLPPSKE